MSSRKGAKEITCINEKNWHAETPRHADGDGRRSLTACRQKSTVKSTKRTLQRSSGGGLVRWNMKMRSRKGARAQRRGAPLRESLGRAGLLRWKTKTSSRKGAKEIGCVHEQNRHVDAPRHADSNDPRSLTAYRQKSIVKSTKRTLRRSSGGGLVRSSMKMSSRKGAKKRGTAKGITRPSRTSEMEDEDEFTQRRKAQRRSGASMKRIGTRTRPGTLMAMTGVPLLLTGKSASSNLQNEIWG